ncbi:MAG: YkvA family protein [Rhodospirillaceae bacterium]|nr:YkvA family protein [Rhodospirillaceae bacterium]MDD9915148.1 YkvA family protein [Rhodospirillaceae bacterium]MDD9927990.1 YkvA family protein [Rhodospirillaceae bacterium]
MSDNPPPGFDLGDYETQERMVRDGLWTKLRRAIGSIDFAREAVAASYCARDPATPARVKAILIGALAYFILPTDVIPDVLVGLGFTDDAAVFWAAWQAVSSHITEDHRQQADIVLKRQDIEKSD